ncbi:MAG TPA: hypothetical protein VFG33_33875 [Kribbella sp.]|uniref:hypothetical protein n=1 Tax=Kribbella sp. TaxID=1871183 RepID=UPI002D78B3A8|nr:hypothetical protein [Kribbella sp.]HET6298414.1 hypothetical protein [Kribbella sp.]
MHHRRLETAMSCAIELAVEAPPSSLWSANFRLYFGARTTSLLGDAMLPVALSVGVLQAGYGAAGVGYPQVANDIQRANGVLRVAESMAAILGPALASVLVSIAGPGAVFAIYAATYGISAACLVAFRADRQRSRFDRTRHRHGCPRRRRCSGWHAGDPGP